MKTCPKCKKEYEDKLPFCLDCEGYVLLDYFKHDHIIILTFAKRKQ